MQLKKKIKRRRCLTWWYIAWRKKGIRLAKNAGKVIKEQNKPLDEMNEDIDGVKEKMNSLTLRFENYVGKYSVCKMIIIILNELAIAIVTGVLLLG